MSWSQWRFYFRSTFNSDRFRITTVLSQILPIVGHFLWLEAGFCQFRAISSLILNCTSLPNYNNEGGTPLCGGGSVFSSVQSWLSAAGDTGDRRQEAGDRPRNTGHRRELASTEGTIVGRGLHIPPAASANEGPARGHVTRLHQ